MHQIRETTTAYKPNIPTASPNNKNNDINRDKSLSKQTNTQIHMTYSRVEIQTKKNINNI